MKLAERLQVVRTSLVAIRARMVAARVLPEDATLLGMLVNLLDDTPSKGALRQRKHYAEKKARVSADVSTDVTPGVSADAVLTSDQASVLTIARARSDQDLLSSHDLTEEISEERAENARGLGVSADASSVPRETEPWTERDQQELDELDPPDEAPDTEPDLPSDVVIWRHWEQAVHGGLPAGSRPRAACFDAVEVLQARGVPLERVPELIAAWLKSRQSAAPPRFDFFARDLATMLDRRRLERRARSSYDNPEADRQMREDLARERAARGPAQAPMRLAKALPELPPADDDPAAVIADWKAAEGAP